MTYIQLRRSDEMSSVEQTYISCPYCGETFDTVVEVLDEDQQYTEDCYVCCRPIVFKVQVAINGDWNVMVFRESDA